MQRLALEFARPQMLLARDVYAQDGTIMISAGTFLTEKLISRLLNREISSVFVENFNIELPTISLAVQETTRNKARLMVAHAFNTIRRAEQFSMSVDEQQTIRSVVEEATQDPRALFHITHIDRNSRDILTHSVNVALLSTTTALSLGINNTEALHEMALAALLHDVGLLMIPQDLIARRSSLTPEESAIYREHSNWGYAILQQASNLPVALAKVAQEHHENFDGTGYPHHLKGSAIYSVSLIVSAVNAYENLCAGLSEGKGCQAHIAYESIMAGAGTRFDTKVARALLSRLPMYPIGSVVELTNGQIGVVLSANQGMPHRPRLKILAKSDGPPLQESYILDLADLINQTIFVREVLDSERATRFITL
jgi:HD-GYP domain-containing protein (c-di-GMP phosphodiesterase class II)